jgi:hypothetical protein
MSSDADGEISFLLLIVTFPKSAERPGIACKVKFLIFPFLIDSDVSQEYANVTFKFPACILSIVILAATKILAFSINFKFGE